MKEKNYLALFAKSFNWAGFFLPKKTLKKCSALYDFCRIADNIADDDGDIESKKKKFDHFENDFKTYFKDSCNSSFEGFFLRILF